jgi:hypothetical protein
MIAAHIAGLPVEELLPLAYGVGGAWTAVLVRARRHRRRRGGRAVEAPHAR